MQRYAKSRIEVRPTQHFSYDNKRLIYHKKPAIRNQKETEPLHLKFRNDSVLFSVVKLAAPKLVLLPLCSYATPYFFSVFNARASLLLRSSAWISERVRSTPA